jgi:hypothetical protein
MKRPTDTAPVPVARIEVEESSSVEITAAAIPCPKCGYSSPDVDFAPRPMRETRGDRSSDGVDICLNCGEFMAFDEALDRIEARVLGTLTPTPVPATSRDFEKYKPETVNRLLSNQSITARLARMRGYDLGRLKFRKGTA